ncbi:MAG: hypothetical protein QM776_07280 [Rhodocyclaceae bacterium]
MLAPRLIALLLGFSLVCALSGARAQLAPEPPADPATQSQPAAGTSEPADASAPAAPEPADQSAPAGQSEPTAQSTPAAQSAPADQSAPPEQSAPEAQSAVTEVPATQSAAPEQTDTPAPAEAPGADELNTNGTGAARLVLPASSAPVAAPPATPAVKAPVLPKAPDPVARTRAMNEAITIEKPVAPVVVAGPSWLKSCKSVQRQGDVIMCDADSLLAFPSEKVLVHVKDPRLVPKSGGMTVRESLPTLYRLFYLP